jgi:anti-sigma B factor antagonist
MAKANINVEVRMVGSGIGILDIVGEINAFAESALMDAYNQASEKGAKAIVLNFTELEFMNSSGIGLLVTLLIRAQRQKQRLLAYGLGEHYQQIFELTRLNEAISIYPDEKEAVAAV